MSQSLQLQAQVMLASLGWCHKSRESVREFVRAYFILFYGIRVVESASMRLLTWQLQSCNLGRRAVKFVRLALKIVM
jgi:hypothetical protein